MPNHAGTDRAKIEDVARVAGVSVMSVSRAMRGVEGVSAAKRVKILHIAKRMNYAPNRVAGTLATAHSTLIGVSVPTLFDTVFAEIFDGMRDVFITAGLQTVIETSEYCQKQEVVWLDRMIAWRPAGVVLSGVHHSPKARAKLSEHQIPTLEIWDYTSAPIDLCIGIDHAAAGRDMATYLLGLGYRKPAYVGLRVDRDPCAEARFNGFAETFEVSAQKACADTRIDLSPSFEAGRLGMRQLLNARDELPDVVYFVNDHLAFGGLEECDAQGVRVPHDMGIVGFNGLNINNVMNRPVTTSITPRARMGEAGARMLVGAINGARVDHHVCLDVELSPGKTTRRQTSFDV